MANFFIKRNDNRPPLDVNLKYEDGAYIDLTVSGISVNFTMKNYSSNDLKIDTQPCTIVDPSNGGVRYSWGDNDTNIAGEYLGEFEVLYQDGGKLTIPTITPLAIIVLEDFNNV